MRSLAADISGEYMRIQSRVQQDPGTAGDQAEENWASLLRNWLPATYPVVTKGRIVNEEGQASPQIDVLVLHPSYPRFLRDKKLYFAAGVIAAFECKLTLRSPHLRKAFSTSKLIKSLTPRREGDPYSELQQPILYGVLAHSHAWPRTDQWVADRIGDSVERQQRSSATHPRELVDLICVADTATLVCVKDVYAGPNFATDGYAEEFVATTGWPDAVSASYISFPTDPEDAPGFQTTALGTLICNLTSRLAWEDSSLRGYADYLERSTSRAGSSRPVAYRLEDCFSDPVIRKLRTSGTTRDRWSRWHEWFP